MENEGYRRQPILHSPLFIYGTIRLWYHIRSSAASLFCIFNFFYFSSASFLRRAPQERSEGFEKKRPQGVAL
jgi:hypothetical protein